MTGSPDDAALKQQARGVWTAGDFGKVAEHIASAAAEFVARLHIPPGSAVLDVACGTGNLAIPAARGGARVTGLDIAPNLLAQARARAAAEGLSATFDEGDAEELPYAAGHFDVVLTMFGAMFAPHPERTAAELQRVCRSGGSVVMANWTRGSFVGEMFALGARYLPPPAGVPSPLEWGDDPTVQRRLGPGSASLRLTRRTIPMDFPFPPADVVQLFRRYFGPTVVAFSRLDPRQQGAYARDLESLWVTRNEATAAGRTTVTGEYLEVVAVRA